MTKETITRWKSFKGPVINCRERGYETGVRGGGGGDKYRFTPTKKREGGGGAEKVLAMLTGYTKCG